MNNTSEWSKDYSGPRLMAVGDKCHVHDGDAMRNATVESFDLEKRTYSVIIDGLGTKISNIPMTIWRPIS